MIYNILSAMVVYDDAIEAINEEEAINKLCADCPYDVEANTIEIEQDRDEQLKGTEREKGVLEQLSEKQNSLLATVKAWDDYIDKHGAIY